MLHKSTSAITASNEIVPPINLNRKFVIYNFANGVEEALNDNYLARYREAYSGLEWNDLLEKDRVVILGEPGSGKSSEFSFICSKLKSEGKYSFLVNLNAITDISLNELIANDRDYKTWLQGDNKLYLFLDAKDETQIFGSETFKQALLILSKWLGINKARTKIFISSRITTWQSTDTQIIGELFQPVQTSKTKKFQARREKSNTNQETEKSTTSEGIPVYTLKGLDIDQIRSLASTKVQDVDKFCDQLILSDYLVFATRPLDVEQIISYWNEYGSLPKTLTDAVEFFIDTKIAENNTIIADATGLSKSDERLGAAALALANIFCKKQNFCTVAHAVNNYNAINPKVVLKNWKPKEIGTLLNRSIFSVSTYQQTRFHHRTYMEYLAADCLFNLYQSNLPYHHLHKLLVIKKGELNVVPISRIATIGWLCGKIPKLKADIIDKNPILLLEHGDPSQLTVSDRRKLLRKIGDHQFLGWRNFSKYHLARIAHNDLVDDLSKLIGDATQHNDVRSLAIDIVAAGHMKDCLPAVLKIATDEILDDDFRINAVICLKSCNSLDLLPELARFTMARGKLSGRELGYLISILYPDFLNENELSSLLDKYAGSAIDLRYWFKSTLEKSIPNLENNRLANLVQVLLMQLAAATSGSTKRITRSNDWLLEPLVLATSELINRCQNINTFDDVIFKAISTTTEQQIYSNSTDDPAYNASLNHSFLLKRRLIINEIERLLSEKDDIIVSYWDLISTYTQWTLTDEDLVWMMEEAAMLPDNPLGNSLFSIAMEASRFFKVTDTVRRKSKEISKNIPRLKLLYKNYHRGFIWRVKSYFQRKYYRHRFRGTLYSWKRKLKKISTWSLVVYYSYKNYSSLCAGRFSLLQNVIFTSHDDKTLSSYSHYNRAEIISTYDRFIEAGTRKGLKKFWREYQSKLPGINFTTVYHATIIALSGISAEFEDGLDFKNMSSKDAKSAALHALHELNGFPVWFNQLIDTHSTTVVNAYRDQLEIEMNISSDNQHPHGLLHDLLYSDDNFPVLFQSTIKEFISKKIPPNEDILLFSLSLLLKYDASNNTFVSDVCSKECLRAIAADDPNLLGRLLSIWIKVDAKATLAFVNSPTMSYARMNEAIIIMASKLYRGEGKEGIAEPDYYSLPYLKDLILLFYKNINPKDDLRHDGVFSPGPRDDAQHFRSSLLGTLIKSNDEKADEYINEVASHPDLTMVRDYLGFHSAEKTRQILDFSSWGDEQIFDYIQKFTRQPNSSSELFDIVEGHLMEIKENSELGDFSLRGKFPEDEDETFFQIWLSGLLEEHGRATYQVAREVEVSDDKLPDIRLFRPTVGTVTVEIKVASKAHWSYNTLLNECLQEQLFEQYMKVSQSSNGILLLINLKKGRTWLADKALNFDELIKNLNEKAQELVEIRNRGEIVKVIGIDLAPL